MLEWYDVASGVITLAIVSSIVGPVVRADPLVLVWPIAYTCYLALKVAVTRTPLIKLWAQSHIVQGFSRVMRRASDVGLRRWMPRAFASADDDQVLCAAHFALQLLFIGAIVLFLVSVRHAYTALHVPTESASTGWLLFVLPILWITRYGSMYWILAISAVAMAGNAGVSALATTNLSGTTLWLIFVQSCWLILISLLPAIVLRFIAESRAGLNSAVEAVRAIAGLRGSAEKDFANEAAAIIAQHMGYAEVNILLATSEDDRVGEGLRMVGAAGAVARKELVDRDFVIEYSKGITGCAAEDRCECIVNDVQKDQRHHGRYFYHPAFPHTKAEMAIPIMLGTRLLGVLDVQSHKRLAFSDDDVELLRAIVIHLSVALQHAQSLERTKGLYDMTHGVTRRLFTQQEVGAVLDEVTSAVRGALTADVVMLYPYTDRDNTLRAPRLAGELGDSLGAVLAEDEEWEAEVLRLVQAGTPRFLSHSPVSRLAADAPSIPQALRILKDRAQMSALVALPLVVGPDMSRSPTIGTSLGIVLIGYRQRRLFTEEYREGCTVLTDIAALALQNTLLYAQVAKQERMDLWSRMHNGVATSISLIRMLLAQMAATCETTGALDVDQRAILQLAYKNSLKLQREVNYLVGILRTDDAQDIWASDEIPWWLPNCDGLLAHLEEYTKLVQRSLRMDCTYIYRGDVKTVSATLQHEARMIVQEAVENAYSHGGASTVVIEVQVDACMMEIRVSDNGTGFDGACIPPGHGLDGLQRRANRRGGDLDICTAPSGGTVVTAQIPLSAGRITA